MKTIAQLIACLICLSSVASESDFSDTFGIDANTSYSATRILQIGGETFTIVERRAPGKLRLEADTDYHNLVHIIRDDLNETYTVSDSTYVRGEYPSPYNPQRETFTVIKSTIVATEELNGLSAVKYRARFKLTHGGLGEGYYWIRQGIMIRVDLRYTAEDHIERHIVMELHDLNIGPQDPENFEVPQGLQDMTNNI